MGPSREGPGPGMHEPGAGTQLTLGGCIFMDREMGLDGKRPSREQTLFSITPVIAEMRAFVSCMA